AHADALNFVLHKDGIPIVIDVGISTYEIGAQRNFERGTICHNTVTINNENQSEVWGGFRVGERAKTNLIIDKDNYLVAAHDGYKGRFGVVHQRSFKFDINLIEIKDEIIGEDLSVNNAIARFYLHPKCIEYCKIAPPDFITFEKNLKVEIKPYKLP